MATFKATALFEASSNASGAAATTRVGGWSESFYYLGGFAAMDFAFKQLCQARAGLLPSAARIIGQRYQSIDPPSAAGTRGGIYPGTQGSNDVPQLSLHLSVPGVGVTNVRPLTLRGLPDAQCTNGEFVPTPAFKANLATFLELLASLGFSFRATDKTLPEVIVESVDADGNFVLVTGLTFVAGTRINLSRLKNSANDTLEGTFKVLSFTSSTVGKFANWGDNGAWVGGFAQLDGVIYPQCSDVSMNPGAKAVVRKVGRPFGGYHGRVTTRR